MMDERAGQERRAYWNEKYRDYWMRRVAESNIPGESTSKLNENDKLTASDAIYRDAINLLDISRTSNVLEMGCGYGRSLPYVHSIAGSVSAIDISEAMIKSAQEKYGHLQDINFQVCEAERTPFADQTFDNIICFGVFDAVFQATALIEMNRIMKIGGTVLVTGKNNNYFDDDKEAYIAEIKARENEHPNFFTDVTGLLDKLQIFGWRVVKSRFYLRRGDISKLRFEENLPEKFYEYFLIFEKKNNVLYPITFPVADTYSLTWQRRNA